MARPAVSGVREAQIDINSVEWNSQRMPRDVFLEEYEDFVRMGLSMQEIARAFATSIDALEHRLRRYGVWNAGQAQQLRNIQL